MVTLTWHAKKIEGTLCIIMNDGKDPNIMIMQKQNSQPFTICVKLLKQTSMA